MGKFDKLLRERKDEDNVLVKDEEEGILNNETGFFVKKELDPPLTEDVFYGVCRCCLAAGDFKSMMRPSTDGAVGEAYADLLQECFDIKIYPLSDEDPSMVSLYLICEACIPKLCDSYTFRCQVLEAQKNYMSVIEMKMPKEVIKLEEDIEDELEDDEQNGTDIDFEPMEDSPTPSPTGKKFKSKSKGKKRGRPKTKIKIKKPGQGTRMSKAEYRKIKIEENKIKEQMDPINNQCKICLQTFNKFHLLKIHINDHYPNHVCNVCGKAYATRRRLQGHSTSHKTGEFPCDQCPKVFTTKSAYHTHRSRHSTPLRYMCPQCPERFNSYVRRRNHVQAVHNVDTYTYKCAYCPRLFASTDTRMNHEKRVHMRVKNYVCDNCGKGFYNLKEYNEHAVVHTGEKTFQCAVCSKSYGRRGTLKMHMKIHEGNKAFMCVICGKAFVQRGNLKGHMKKHERQLKNIAEGKPVRVRKPRPPKAKPLIDGHLMHIPKPISELERQTMEHHSLSNPSLSNPGSHPIPTSIHNPVPLPIPASIHSIHNPAMSMSSSVPRLLQRL